MTIGKDRVRVSFNPSSSQMVDQLKVKTAELIDLLELMRRNHPDDASAHQRHRVNEHNRCLSLAQTYYETAAMYAVKAATMEE